MAEVLGAVSAVVNLLEISAEVLDAGYSYIRKAAKAPTEIRKLLMEVSAIDTVLADMRDLAKPGADTNRTLASLAEKGHLEECEKTLSEAKGAVEKFSLEDGQHAKNAGKRLLYPLKEGQLRKLLTHLEIQRKTFSDAVALDAR